jgi:hypothetical protein
MPRKKRLQFMLPAHEKVLGEIRIPRKKHFNYNGTITALHAE